MCCDSWGRKESHTSERLNGLNWATELTDSYVVQLVKNQLETEIIIKKKPLFLNFLFLFVLRCAATSLNLADILF